MCHQVPNAPVAMVASSTTRCRITLARFPDAHVPPSTALPRAPADIIGCVIVPRFAAHPSLRLPQKALPSHSLEASQILPRPPTRPLRALHRRSPRVAVVVGPPLPMRLAGVTRPMFPATQDQRHRTDHHQDLLAVGYRIHHSEPLVAGPPLPMRLAGGQFDRPRRPPILPAGLVPCRRTDHRQPLQPLCQVVPQAVGQGLMAGRCLGGRAAPTSPEVKSYASPMRQVQPRPRAHRHQHQRFPLPRLARLARNHQRRQVPLRLLAV